MPWHRVETGSGAGERVEASINRYPFTIGLTPVLSVFLAVLIGRVRNTFRFGLLLAPPILLFSVTVCWKLSGKLWPGRPS